MDYDIAVLALPAENCLQEFLDFYEIEAPDAKLVPLELSFRETIEDMGHYDSWQLVADKAEELFGLPARIMVLEDEAPVLRGLETSEGGVGPFYVMFWLAFCEYEGFTLCFMAGSNDCRTWPGCRRAYTKTAGRQVQRQPLYSNSLFYWAGFLI